MIKYKLLRELQEYNELWDVWKNKKHLHTFGLLVSMVSFQVASFYIQVNGRLTLGENIADNGGIKESFTVSSFLNESVLFAPGNQATWKNKTKNYNLWDFTEGFLLRSAVWTACIQERIYQNI